MDEERFNISLRRLLKQFGVTAQREVEKAVAAGLESGALSGRATSLRAGRTWHPKSSRPSAAPRRKWTRGRSKPGTS